MANKTLNTRIQLRYDTFSAWKNSTEILAEGEVAIALVSSSDTDTGLEAGSSGIYTKVGDGKKVFKALPWANAMPAPHNHDGLYVSLSKDQIIKGQKTFEKHLIIQGDGTSHDGNSWITFDRNNNTHWSIGVSGGSFYFNHGNNLNTSNYRLLIQESGDLYFKGGIHSNNFQIAEKNDNSGIFPYANNWNQIGSSSKYWYRAYINNIYATTLHGHLNGTATDIALPSSTQGVPTAAWSLWSSTRANRLAFLPPENIITEWSIDGGATWTAYEVSDDRKIGFFSQRRPGLYIPQKNGKKSCDCMLRITITGMRFNVPEGTPENQKYQYWTADRCIGTERYTSLNGMFLWVSADHEYIYCKAEKATGRKPNEWSLDGEGYCSGWSGSDFIKLGGYVFGGGTTQLDNTWFRRFTFRTASGKKTFNDADLTPNYTKYQQSVAEITAFGQSVWTAPNNLMSIDHIYNWDTNQNVSFPANITASKFIGNLQGTADNATKLNNKAATDYALSASLANYLPLAGGTLSGDLSFNHTSSVTPGNIIWSSGTSRQKITIYDGQGGNNPVFAFLQSSNSGSTYTELFKICGNGNAFANSKLLAFKSDIPSLPTNHVTTNTEQTITGFKTFSNKLLINTGDATLKFYSKDGGTGCGSEDFCLQSCFDNEDGETHVYPTNHSARCNIVLQPRGGQVCIGDRPQNPETGRYLKNKLFVDKGLQIHTSETASQRHYPVLTALKGVSPESFPYQDYDIAVFAANDVPCIRLVDADGTQATFATGDSHSAITSTHDLKFYVKAVSNGSGFNGAGGKLALTLQESGTTTEVVTSGNITGNYLKGTWLQTTATTDLSAAAKRFAVLRDDGYIYTRTPTEVLTDIGAADADHTHDNRYARYISGSLNSNSLQPAGFFCGYNQAEKDQGGVSGDFGLLNIPTYASNRDKYWFNTQIWCHNGGHIQTRHVECTEKGVSTTAWATLLTSSNYNTYIDEYVKLSDDQSISGTKTFISPIVIPAPTAENHGVNKKYVDGQIAIVNNTISGLSGDIAGVSTNLDAHKQDKRNPHGVTAAQVGALPIGGGTLTGNLIVSGNLTINGTTTTIDSTSLLVKDKVIEVARGNTAQLTSMAGLVVPKYDGTNGGALVFDYTGTAYVGDLANYTSGDDIVLSKNPDLQPLATRAAESNLTDSHLLKWDGTNKKIVDSGKTISSFLSINGGTVNGNITATKFIGDLQGTATTATNVKDASTNTTITLKYSGSNSIKNPAYYAVWNGYQITFTSQEDARKNLTSNCVTLDTNQIISGRKAFKQPVLLSESSALQFDSNAKIEYNINEECIDFIFI